MENISDSLKAFNFENSVLPFKRVDNIEHNLTWADFDQDETGECVYIYRAIENADAERDRDFLHKSKAAMFGETEESVLDRLGTSDKQAIAKLATEFFQGDSPVLHTTRSKSFVDGFVGRQGVVITYKIPKSWLLEEKNQPYIGSVAESELDFFHSLPQEFVHKAEQKGEAEPLIAIEDLLKSEAKSEVEIVDVDIPPPPEDVNTF